MWGLFEQLIIYTRGKIFMRQGMFWEHFLCDRVQGLEGFSTQSCHFPDPVPPTEPLNSLFLVRHNVQSSDLEMDANLKFQD